jgi:hypothetical protein
MAARYQRLPCGHAQSPDEGVRRFETRHRAAGEQKELRPTGRRSPCASWVGRSIELNYVSLSMADANLGVLGCQQRANGSNGSKADARNLDTFRLLRASQFLEFFDHSDQ